MNQSAAELKAIYFISAPQWEALSWHLVCNASLNVSIRPSLAHDTAPTTDPLAATRYDVVVNFPHAATLNWVIATVATHDTAFTVAQGVRDYAARQ